MAYSTNSVVVRIEEATTDLEEHTSFYNAHQNIGHWENNQEINDDLLFQNVAWYTMFLDKRSLRWCVR